MLSHHQDSADVQQLLSNLFLMLVDNESLLYISFYNEDIIHVHQKAHKDIKSSRVRKRAASTSAPLTQTIMKCK